MARETEASKGPPGGEQGDFWAKATAPKGPERPPMKRWKKVAVFGGGGLLLVLVALVAAAPLVAGRLVPGIVESSAAEKIAGKVDVSSASFSWFGTQRIGPVTLIDRTKPAGSNEIATVNIEVSRGLLGLVTGGLNIGEVKVSGGAKIVRYTDGTTNLDHAMAPVNKVPAPKPGGGGSKEPASVPKGLNATVVIDSLDLSYVDDLSPSSNASLKGVKGEASIGPGAGDGVSARVKLSGKASGGKGGGTGTLKIDVKVDQLADAGGVIQAQKAKVDASVQVEGVPTELVDALSGMGGRLAAGLGPTLGVSVEAKGTLKSATAAMKVDSAGADLRADLGVNDSVLSASSPIVAHVKGEALRALGDVDARLKASGAALTRAPDVTLTVDTLRLKVPAAGAALDFAGAGLDATLKTSESSGTVSLGEGQAAQPFTISPLEARVGAPDLSGPVKVTAGANATMGGKPAGTLGVDLTARNVLAIMKGAGAAPAEKPMVEGKVQLKGIATAIAQPFASAAKLDLGADVGPTLDVEAKVATGTGAGAGDVPPITAELSVASAKVNAKGGFEIKDSVLKSAGGPFTFTADSVGGLASRFLDPKSGIAMAPGGAMTVSVSDVVVPFKEGSLSKPRLDKAGAKIGVSAKGVVLTSTRPGNAGRLEVGTLAVNVLAAPGAAAKLDMNGAMTYGGKPFTLTGAMDLPGLYSFTPEGAPVVTPVAARPTGTIELKGVPTGVASLVAMGDMSAPELAGVIVEVTETTQERWAVAGDIERGLHYEHVAGPFDAGEAQNQSGKPLPPPPAPASGQPPAPVAKPAAPPTPAAPALDMGKFLSDALGPTVDVRLTCGAAKGSDGVDLALAARAERLNADVQGSLSDRSVDVRRVGVDATVAPSTLDTVLATYAPNLSPRPQLAGTSKLTLAVDPVSIPVIKGKDGASKLDLARAGVATVKVSLPQQTLLQKMVRKNADGTSADLGQLGVEGFDVTAKVPLGAADPQMAGAQHFDATLSGRVLDGPGSAMMKLSGTAAGELGAGGVRSADASFKVSDVRVASIDRLAGKSGLVSGAVGDAAAINVDAKARPAPDGKGLSTEVSLDLQSARVKMNAPLRVTMLPDRLKSDQPLQIAWQIDPAWANQVLLAPQPGQTGGSPKLSAPVNATVTLSKFAISSGEGRGPLLASVFDLGAGVVLSATEIAMPDGSTIKLSGTRANLQSAPGGAIAGDKSGAQSAGVAFDVKIDEVAVTQQGGNPPPAKAVALTGTVTGLSDAKGAVSASTAAVTASGDVPAIPTALIDALARQNGLLVDALGPTTSVKLRADRFGAAGGTLDMTAKSERASASVRGAVADKVFVTSEPIKASLTEITAGLARRFVKGMPLVGTVEKKPTDEPALITASSMRVPMDNDLRKLEGEVLIDPGVARFTSGETFGGILKALNQKTEANIGQRIDPLNVHIKQGVATYDKWTVPIGQNRLNTQGTVDLVNETVDVVTYIPLGALSEDVAGLFKAQAKLKAALGQGLDEKLMVPFRSRGSFGKVKTEPDMDLFVKETLKNIKPEDLLKKGLDDLLKPKPKPAGGGK